MERGRRMIENVSKREKNERGWERDEREMRER